MTYDFSLLDSVPDANLIFSALQSRKGDSRFIGGCVRDAIATKAISAIDIETTLLPQETQEALTEYGIKNFPTGIEHGTITAVINRKNFEITSLREDIATNGRRAIVKFTKSWEKDAARRDFTINAMSYCPVQKKFYDYFNGREDLASKLIRFIRDPEQRVQEDYLRILRYFRFLAYYGSSKKIDALSLAACEKYAPGIANLSAERKWQEFKKILLSPNNIWVLRLMLKHNVLKHLIQKATPESLNICEHLHLLAKERDISHLALLFLLSNQDKEIIKELKLNNQEKKYILDLLNILPLINKESLAKLAYKYGKDFTESALIIHFSISNKAEPQLRSLLTQLQDIIIKPLPISGLDIMMELDIKQNPTIGKLLEKAEDYWIKSNFLASRSELLKNIK